MATRRQKTCNKCPLSETAGEVNVKGERLTGKGDIDILVIGQSPEEEDDNAGRLGYGPASRLLLDLIKEVDLDKYSVWYTTAVKCMPPNETKPKKANIESCRCHLRKEIDRLSPKLIVACGDVALKSVTAKNVGISKVVGVPMTTEYGVKCVPVFHPNYVLNRPGALKQQISLFRVVKRTLENADHDPTKETEVKVVSSYKDVRSLFTGLKKVTAFDYETAGFAPTYDALNPMNGYIRTISVTDTVGKAWVVPIREPGMELSMKALSVVEKWLKGKTAKVAHNATFEAYWSYVFFNGWPHITDDTKRMFHLLNENDSNRLTDLTMEYLPEMAGYDAEMDEFLSPFTNRGEGYSVAPFDMLAHYNGQDSDATLRLLKLFKPQLVQDPQLFSLYTTVTMPSSMLTSKFQQRGMAVDPDALSRSVSSMEKKLKRVTNELSGMPEVHRTNRKLNNEVFNPRSPKQVCHLLYKEMKLKSEVKTKTGNPSAGEEALKELPQGNRAVQILLELSKIKGLMNTLTAYRDNMVQDPKTRKWYIRSSYDNAFIVTGRLSCREPNLMAIPRPDEGIKYNVSEAFVSRFKMGRLVYADYSQLELRLLAEMTKEPEWYDGFCHDPKFDPHQATADRNRVSRTYAKRINFGVVYGMGAAKLAKALNIDYLAARDILDGYWANYGHIKDWFDDQHLEVTTKGQVRTLMGRIRRLPDGMLLPDSDPAQWRAARQGPNFMIQGYAADIVGYAMVELDRRLETNGLRAVLVNQIHDALVVDAPRDEVKVVKEIMGEVMEEVAPSLCGVSVPLRADVKVIRDLSKAG